jgi:hypothetical protein
MLLLLLASRCAARSPISFSGHVCDQPRAFSNV